MRKNTFLWIGLALLLTISTVLGAVFLARRNAVRDAGSLGDEQPDIPPISDEKDPPVQEVLPEEDKEGTVHFLAAGDIVLHESVFLDANLRAGGTGVSGTVDGNSAYDFVAMYEKVASTIREADIAMVNQETLVGADTNGRPTGYEVGFNGPTAAGDALSKVGFDVVNIGNNHMLDRGSSGLNLSLSYWKTQPQVTLLGAYTSREDCDAFRTVTVNGVKIAFLSYLGNTPGTNGFRADSSLYIPYLEEQLVRSQVSRARESADCVIVTVHWGWEGTYSTNSEQRTYAELFASLGVDAVIGTHPHVLQPMQWMDRTGYDDGKMLLCYSLGDFLSHTQLAGGKNAYGNLLGGFVSFDIVRIEEGVKLENVVFTPTVSHYDDHEPMDTGFLIYPLEDYTDALLARFGDPKAGFTSVSQLKSIVKQNIPVEFLSEAFQ